MSISEGTRRRIERAEKKRMNALLDEPAYDFTVIITAENGRVYETCLVAMDEVSAEKLAIVLVRACGIVATSALAIDKCIAGTMFEVYGIPYNQVSMRGHN